MEQIKHHAFERGAFCFFWVGYVKLHKGYFVSEIDGMDKGIYEPLLVFLVLFVRAALELGQHKNELVTVIDRRGGGFINGGQLGTQYAFLFFEITQPGREPGAAGAVLYGAHNIILLSDILGQLCFQHFLFGILPPLICELYSNHAISNLFQLARGKDIIGGSGGN